MQTETVQKQAISTSKKNGSKIAAVASPTKKVAVIDKAAAQKLAAATFRELRNDGCADQHVIAFASEMLKLVTQEIKS